MISLPGRAHARPDSERARARSTYAEWQLAALDMSSMKQFRLPEPDTRIVVCGEHVFKIKYKMR